MYIMLRKECTPIMSGVLGLTMMTLFKALNRDRIGETTFRIFNNFEDRIGSGSFSHMPINEEAFFLSYLDAVGTRLDELKDVRASVYLYDLR